MKIIKKFILLLIVITLVSCNSVNDKKNSNSSSYLEYETDNDFEIISELPEEVYTINCDNEFINKKQLTLLIDQTKPPFLPNIDSEIINQLNKKLERDGYDFAINLKVINAETIASIDYYEKLMKDNKIIDIIFSNSSFSQETINNDPDFLKCKAHENIFWEYIDNSYFISLNKYFETPQGKKLYKTFPNIHFETFKDKDNNIYGISNIPLTPIAFDFNKDVAKKYNYEYKNFNGNLTSLENVLKKMKKESNIAGLYINPLYAPYNEYLGFSCFESGIYLNENTGKAENIFENKCFIKYVNKVGEFSNKGYILDLDKNPENSEKILCSTSYFDADWDSNQIIVSNRYMKSKESHVGAGITTLSKYPKESFQLLCLLYTNSEYSTLLQCGIEGRNYTVKNSSKVELNEEYATFAYPSYLLISNPYITNRGTDVDVFPAKEKQKLLKENFKHIKKSKAYGFSYPKSEKTEEIRKIYEKYEGLYYGKYEDVDETLKKANDELKKAGIDEVLTDVNRQLDEFYKDKSSN